MGHVSCLEENVCALIQVATRLRKCPIQHDWFKGFLCLREINQSFITVPLDDDSSTFYDVYLKEVGKKDRQTKKLLDAFGTKMRTS